MFERKGVNEVARTHAPRFTSLRFASKSLTPWARIESVWVKKNYAEQTYLYVQLIKLSEQRIQEV